MTTPHPESRWNQQPPPPPAGSGWSQHQPTQPVVRSYGQPRDPNRNGSTSVWVVVVLVVMIVGGLYAIGNASLEDKAAEEARAENAAPAMSEREIEMLALELTFGDLSRAEAADICEGWNSPDVPNDTLLDSFLTSAGEGFTRANVRVYLNDFCR